MDISIHFGGFKTRCFFRRHADILGHQSFHEKRVLSKMTCKCLEGSWTISIRDHGDQIGILHETMMFS